MAWQEGTLRQCLSLLLKQVGLEEREQQVPGLHALPVTCWLQPAHSMTAPATCPPGLM